MYLYINLLTYGYLFQLYTDIYKNCFILIINIYRIYIISKCLMNAMIIKLNKNISYTEKDYV